MIGRVVLLAETVIQTVMDGAERAKPGLFALGGRVRSG